MRVVDKKKLRRLAERFLSQSSEYTGCNGGSFCGGCGAQAFYDKETECVVFSHSESCLVVFAERILKETPNEQ